MACMLKNSDQALVKEKGEMNSFAVPPGLLSATCMSRVSRLILAGLADTLTGSSRLWLRSRTRGKITTLTYASQLSPTLAVTEARETSSRFLCWRRAVNYTCLKLSLKKVH